MRPEGQRLRVCQLSAVSGQALQLGFGIVRALQQDLRHEAFEDGIDLASGSSEMSCDRSRGALQHFAQRCSTKTKIETKNTHNMDRAINTPEVSSCCFL